MSEFERFDASDKNFISNIHPVDMTYRTKDSDIVKMILSIDGNAIRFLDHLEPEWIDIAFETTPSAIQYIPLGSDYFSADKWIELVTKEYNSKTSETHVVNVIKTLKDTKLRHDLYREFILSNRNMAYVIVNQFTDLDELCQIDLWKTLLIPTIDDCAKISTYFDNYDNYVFYMRQFDIDVFMDCPDNIKSYILPEVLSKDLRYLESCNSDMWRYELMFDYIKKYPHKIKWVLNDKCEGKYDNDPNYIHIAKAALDSCKIAYDAECVLGIFMPRKVSVDDFAILLESKNWPWVIERGIVELNIDRDKAMYMIDKFKIETLCDKIEPYILKMVFEQLPVFKYISCMNKMKKYLKKQKRIDEI